MASARDGSIAQVDSVVAEQGYKIPVPEDSALKVATATENTIGGTGPTAWWRYGLVALLLLALVLLAAQFMGGNRQTDMIPGTPTTAPTTTPVASAA